MRTEKKTLNKRAFFLSFAAIVATALIALAVLIAVTDERRAYAASSDEVDYVFEAVPIESIKLEADGNLTEIQPRQSFTVSFEVAPWFTTTSKVYIDVLPQTAAVVSQVSAVVLKNGRAQGHATLTVCENAQVGSEFTVTASADGVASGAVELTVAKIPVEGITLALTGTDDKLHVGKTRTVKPEFTPSYATVQDVRYEVSGSGAQYIEAFDEATGTITAKAGVTLLDVNSTVTITAYSTDNPNVFDSVTLTLYMPTTVVDISATTPLGRTIDGEPLAVANSKRGDTVQLHTRINDTESLGLNYVIVEGQEYVENGIVRSDGAFTLRPTSDWSEDMKTPHPRIKIRTSYSDGFDEIVVPIYIPVERIEFVNNVPTEVENFRTYDMSVKAFPEYATLNNGEPIVYSLSGVDSSVAEISSYGVLRLPKSLTSKGSVIRYSAGLKDEWAGVDIAPLTHDITVIPVYATAFESVTVTKNGVPVDSDGIKIMPTDTLNVEVEYTKDNVTDIDVSLSADSPLLSVEGCVVRVASLDKMTSDNPYVSVTVSYSNGGNAFDEVKWISIYVPARSAEIADVKFMRDKTIDLNAYVIVNGHGYASNKSIEWGQPVVVGNGNLSADCENGMLRVDPQANAGTIVRVPYMTFDGDEWQYKEFTVSPLEGAFSLTYGKIFNDSDAREYDVDCERPQLEEGQSVEFVLNFNGVQASTELGLTYSVEVSDNATLIYTGANGSGDVFRLSAKAGQSGKNNLIRFTITVNDGSSAYSVYTDGVEVAERSVIDLEIKYISVFKRISGVVGVTNDIVEEGDSFELIGWDDSVTFAKEDLSWRISGGKMSGSEISSAPTKGFILTISASQLYNGTEIAFSVEIPFYSVVYYNESTVFERVYVKQGHSVTLEDNVITKTDHVNIGWSTSNGGGVDYAFGSVYSGSRDLKLYAKWVRVKYQIKSTVDVTIHDDNAYSYRQDITPSFDIGDLKSAGYTSVEITIVFDCKEINDGYQDVRIFSGSDSNRIGDRTVEHGAGHKDTSWWAHTVTYLISLDSFDSNDASFYIGWGAHGGLGDDWLLGTRTVTVVAK